MLAVDRRLLQNVDWVVCGQALALALIGVANLVSAAPDSTQAFPALAARQLVWVGVSLLAMVLILLPDYREFDRLALPAYVACLVLLLLVLFVGPVIKGSQRWLVFGPLRVQPAEVAKIVLVLVMARAVHRRFSGRQVHPRDLAATAALALLPVLLILQQPDLGSGLLLLLIAGSFLVLVPVPLRWLAWLGAALGAAATATWFFYLHDYQKDRLLTFLDPDRDPLGAAYHTIQSQIAIGSGGLWGKGFMQGSQSQLQFLPEQPTDFVFSVLGEEWGFVGASFVLLVYLGLLIRGLVIARTAKDLFGTGLAVGAVAMLFWPAAVNVAMVVALLPVVGIPLPFLSYGGSSLVVSFLAAGLLMNVSMRRYLF